jgi:hypothetical protein
MKLSVYVRGREAAVIRNWPAGKVFAGISDPPKLEKTSATIGRSPLLAARSSRAPRANKEALSPTPQ